MVEASPLDGPRRLGIRPGHPAVFRLSLAAGSASAVRVSGLPDGLQFDPSARIVRGRTRVRGNHALTISGEGKSAPWTDRVVIAVGDDICLTPPLGWNSWNSLGPAVSEEDVRRTAAVLVSSGLADRGWAYLNIDDGWQGGRDRRGHLQPNGKFSDLKALCADLHELGLRVGIYSSPGSTTCGGFEGSAGHELDDALSFGAWGFDYLKYDWCSAGPIGDDTPVADLAAPYERMRVALNRVDRDIVYHISQYGFGNVWEWARGRVGANAWRTTGDIVDEWPVVDQIGFGQAAISAYSGPGGWNDADMLVVGNIGGAWNRPIEPSRLTPNEQRTHFGLWVLLSGPLLLGCDVTRLDVDTTAMVSNRELLAIHQDALGESARRRKASGYLEFWCKTLADGSVAVGIFNRGATTAVAGVAWAELEMRPARAVRDVWAQEDVDAGEGWQGTVPSHGSVILRQWSVES